MTSCLNSDFLCILVWSKWLWMNSSGLLNFSFVAVLCRKNKTKQKNLSANSLSVKGLNLAAVTPSTTTTGTQDTANGKLGTTFSFLERTPIHLSMKAYCSSGKSWSIVTNPWMQWSNGQRKQVNKRSKIWNRTRPRALVQNHNSQSLLCWMNTQTKECAQTLRNWLLHTSLIKSWSA